MPFVQISGIIIQPIYLITQRRTVYFEYNFRTYLGQMCPVRGLDVLLRDTLYS